MSGRQTDLPHPALVALNRFGFGAQGHPSVSFKQIAADPRGYLKGELDLPDATVIPAPLPSTAQRMAEFFAYRANVRAAREKSAAASKQTAPSGMEQPPPVNAPPAGNANDAGIPNAARNALREEAQARFAKTLAAPIGFAERLVVFWSNHFCVSAARAQPVRTMAGSFEREAIRPHALGRFANMLRAAEQHPAMIFYLDNHVSIGPNSRAGRNRGRGLNENLAREILELHTLGVNGGYT
ncbi:MAG: DUF1800 family protein, partial [Alphaproteobacteria bacterium]|nr:DUF1800 family protein [Alphaproteobacteria bacterium]